MGDNIKYLLNHLKFGMQWALVLLRGQLIAHLREHFANFADFFVINWLFWRISNNSLVKILFWKLEWRFKKLQSSLIDKTILLVLVFLNQFQIVNLSGFCSNNIWFVRESG
ncbi:hypothetical protein P344_03230 [Spiroplasma mirum ATCC 29335]|uniref:Uncharacterized protein n=1 Tax=Spiroplasma mirum ATCC 29335 TaxID=838561 RepID=W6AMP1_9MOLU|nr:hypothetical protein P344_03230 [Spiroplasma mirum ATCC 29335]